MDQPAPIAVIGIGCRFPGGANSTQELWELLAAGRDAWTPVPASRWNEEAFFHPDPEHQGMHNHRGGHFLDQDISAFDGPFFGLAQGECEAIDPQHRVQMEVAYEALENAGIPLEKIGGSKTAVFMATFSADYNLIQQKDVNQVPKYHTTGIGNALAANRISYAFNLKGPSITIDTGCSGSLVAVHQACQSLRLGECTMALAGGVNLMLSPDQMVTMSLMRRQSSMANGNRVWNPDGKCYSFDSRGTSGYGRGEGSAVVALKMLNDAIRDGDPIRGIIRNSGVNQDGKTTAIMVPDPTAQTQLITSVHEQIGLDPRHTTYVEAHGTGTAVGDPLEFSAIATAFRPTASDLPLYLGTLKPNIGHLESASGIASLIKGILMLEHNQIAPTINIQCLRPDLEIEHLAIQIPRCLTSWPHERLGRISINNFGYGGTNSHVIVESLHCFQNKQTARPSEAMKYHGFAQHNLIQAFQIIVVSARSKSSVFGNLQRLRQWASSQNPNNDKLLQDVAHTLSCRRSMLPYRIAFPAISMGEIATQIESGKLEPTKSRSDLRMIFVFTGQGSQWYAMGRELMAISSPYLHSLEISESILHQLGATWSLTEELSKDKTDSRVNESEISQPATTAIQIGLVDFLVQVVGASPAVVVGHSSGEIAAAYAAGAIDQHNALKAAYYRGKLKKPQKGAMLAVGMHETHIASYIQDVKLGKLSVACANSSKSCTVSGDEPAIREAESRFVQAGISARKLLVDTAYHSHHMEALSEIYLQDLNGLEWKTTREEVLFVSSVTGNPKTTEFGDKYWTSNLVGKVKFHNALAVALREVPATKKQRQVLIEIGPHSALSSSIRQTLAESSVEKDFFLSSALQRNCSSLNSISKLIGGLLQQGVPVNLQRVNSLFYTRYQPQVLTSLPPYVWNHSNTYWHESYSSSQHRFRKHPYNPLLGIQIPGQTYPRPTWRHFVSISRMPWLRDHVVDGEVLFPASGYMCMALEAARQLATDCGHTTRILGYQLKDIFFVAPLSIPDIGGPLELQTRLFPIEGTEWDDFRIVSLDSDGASIEHCRGSIMALFDSGIDETDMQGDFSGDPLATKRLIETQTVSMKSVDPQGFYHTLKSKGNSYGPNFSSTFQLSHDNGSVISSHRISATADNSTNYVEHAHIIHPTTLDSLLHPSIAIFHQVHNGKGIVTASIDEMRISTSISNQPGTKLDAVTHLQDVWVQTCTTNIHVAWDASSADENLDILLEISNLKLQALHTAGGASAAVSARRDMCYGLRWEVDADFLTADDIASSNAINEQNELRQAEKLQKLNIASAVYIERCLAQMANSKRALVAAHHTRFLEWLRRFEASPEYQSLLQSRGSTERLLNEACDLGVEGEVLEKLGENLTAIVTGDKDPLSLISEEDLLWRLYGDDSSARCYDHAIKYLKPLVFKDPNMSVLEIGAGTGSASEPILEALSAGGIFPFASYDFTDVSTAFFERSMQRLKRWEAKINYRKLDVQEDAVGQGFKEGTYDLIFASNVLHVATSIDLSLSHIRKLLKPDGRVLMIETIRNVPFYNTCLGTLPGWWAGKDDDRSDGPFLTINGWDEVLKRNGFDGTTLVARDFEGPAHRCAMIVSRTAAPSCNSLDRVPIHMIACPTWAEPLSTCVSDLFNSLGSKFQNIDLRDIMRDELCLDSLHIVVDNGSRPVLTSQDPVAFKAITRLVTSPANVLWITIQEDTADMKKPERGLVNGFAKGARAENKDLKLVVLDVQQPIVGETHRRSILGAMEKIIKASFLQKQRPDINEQDYILKNDQLLIQRLLPDHVGDEIIARALGRVHNQVQPFHQPSCNLRLAVERARFIDSLEFQEDEPSPRHVNSLDVEIEVHACGVNFKDILIASGHTKQKLQMGGEFSGEIIRVGAECRDRYAIGDRVCGFGATPYASRARVRASAIAKIPKHMSHTTAASIPVAFATAYHALIDIAQLEKGQSILVNSAAGGVGQAAIAIAQWKQVTVFAIVGNPEKKELLVSKYGLSPDHVFWGRSQIFKNRIRHVTNDRGVDVVLNSLSGQALHDSLDCVAMFGTFVELGKSDAQSGAKLSMAPLNRGIKIAAIDMAMMYQFRPERVGVLLRLVLSLIEKQQLKIHSNITIFPIAKIRDAFRMMQDRHHVGKIVLDAGPGATVEASPELDNLILPSDGTYIIAGGRGGIGLKTAEHLVCHGAKYIVILSRSKLDPAKDFELKDKFKSQGAFLDILCCDITQINDLDEVLDRYLPSLPPVRGVINSAMVLRDRTLNDMEVTDFAECIAPKVQGTQNLMRALSGHPIDFFLLLSSVAGVVDGTVAESNYGAANSFMASLAESERWQETRFITICPGVIDDVGIISQDKRVKQILQQRGFPPIGIEELLAVVSYALSEDASSRSCNIIAYGFDHRSFSDSDNADILRRPLLSHLKPTVDVTSTQPQRPSQRVDVKLANASTRDEAELIVALAISRKIATLVALEREEIEISQSIRDLGVDSLVVVELKNWISHTFQARVQSSEVSDTDSIMKLARLVASRSPMVTERFLKPTIECANSPDAVHDETLDNFATADTSSGQGALTGISDEPKLLPKQPLPDLTTTLGLWLEAVRPIFNVEEFEEAKRLTKELDRPEGQGRKLQARLSALANNPAIDNWQEELYTRNYFLRSRDPIVPQMNFFGTHPFHAGHHSAAERAAVIANACIQFRDSFRKGMLGQEFVNGQPLERNQYEWFFNTTRVPQANEDVLMRYPDNEYLVAFRQGWAFKIGLKASLADLETQFQAIVDCPFEKESWVGVLTTDNRDRWASTRKLLQEISAQNLELLHTIDAAAFIMYLDKASPKTAMERGDQFLHADGFNRWCDKTVQFAVCDNGYSATIGEHSMIDGYAMRRLNSYVTKAIREYKREPQDSSPVNDFSLPKGYAFETSEVIEKLIVQARSELKTRTDVNALASFECEVVGTELFRKHKVPSKTGIQLACQLAARIYFGFSPIGHETVSLAHFSKGRVDFSHTLWPAVKEFCDAVADGNRSEDSLRGLFLEASKTHAANLMRSSRGYGIDRHLLCMEWSVLDGEQIPEFFSSELYQRSRPSLLVTDCLEAGVLESGALPSQPGGLWIHFEPEPEKTRFSVWGPREDINNVEDILKQSVMEMRRILET
ncbi:hypothetical protein BS50DRAFT_622687 [Corynespora cassiicola Philippines]|uniref:Uncharacterized protein n=1 Tax=Corynespora cassiicola Philippines TaxID=1448308 RepID=A0A2T2NJ79_CORCC|nr:hypothetical protein BS50DRAFT_622687 [Corynespora cassiicola Philippines]